MPLAKSPAFAQAEMILRAKYQKARIKPIAVEYHARSSGRGALGGIHDILWSLYDMFRFRLITWKILGKRIIYHILYL